MLNLLATSTAAAAFFLTAGTATPLPHDGEQSTDKEHVLDEIVTDGPVHPELGPQTGEFVFRPVLYLKPHSRGNRIRRIDFYFSPVEESSNGVASLYSEQARSRYRVSVQVPTLNPIGTNRKTKTDRIDLGTHTLDLPGGTYVLSEIKYTLLASAFLPGGFGAGGGGNFGSGFSSVVLPRSYCLNEETYAFDIQNGETRFLGGMAVNEIPSNRARFSEHFPVIGIDNRLELVSGPQAQDTENIIPIDFDLLSFEAEPGLCGGGRNYYVSALAPR